MSGRDERPDTSGAIHDIKYVGDLLCRVDAGVDVPPNTLSGIGDLITRLCDRALEELRRETGGDA